MVKATQGVHAAVAELNDDEEDCDFVLLLTRPVSLRSWANMATEPEEITLSDKGPLFLEVGTEVKVDAPVVTPEDALKGIQFEVSPPLPAGLSLNEDGSITGTPTEPVAQGAYTITASNRAGAVSASITMRVRFPDLTSAHARSFEDRDATYADTNIFCRIAEGSLPSHKVYEDEHCIAFLDINPASKGHTLITPKKLYQSLDVVPPEVLVAIMTALPKLALAVCDAVGAKDYQINSYNGSLAGQTVFNTHFYIIPRLEGDGMAAHAWTPLPTPPTEELEELAEAITGLVHHGRHQGALE